MRLNRILVKSFLPARPKRAHKGTFGRVLVIAGSARMAGAAVLCVRAALQSGAGLVCLALPRSCQCVAAAAIPESLTIELPEQNGVISTTAVSKLEEFIKEFRPSVLLIGPGLAQAPFIVPFLKKNKLPAVVDADALNALACTKNFKKILSDKFPLICTPHPGEMARLLGHKIAENKKARGAAALDLSKRTNGISVLKGFETVISDGKKTFVNVTGGPALAKAGSGDVLAGIIAGLWAQLGVAEGFDNTSALKAAAAGAYLHGLCGDLAAKELTDRAVLASDVAAQLPHAWKRVLRGR